MRCPCLVLDASLPFPAFPPRHIVYVALHIRFLIQVYHGYPLISASSLSPALKLDSCSPRRLRYESYHLVPILLRHTWLIYDFLTVYSPLPNSLMSITTFSVSALNHPVGYPSLGYTYYLFRQILTIPS